MDLYQNLRMLDIPGLPAVRPVSARLPAKTSHSSVKYQYFIVPIFPYTHVSFLSVFGFLLIYLSGTGSLFETDLTALYTARRYLDTPMTAVTDLDGIIKTFRQCDPHRLFRFQYPAEIRLARKRQISITWRKAGRR